MHIPGTHSVYRTKTKNTRYINEEYLQKQGAEIQDMRYNICEVKERSNTT